MRIYAIQLRAGGYGFYLELDQGEKPYWVGQGAQMLVLEGEASAREFYWLERGVDPKTGEVLRSRQSHDLTHAGRRIALGRAAYDVVVMAPKTASIAALLDDRIVAAHNESVKVVAEQLENLAQVRVRTGPAHDTNESRPTQNIVAAVWRHDNSRELDPLLHSHILIANLTFDQRCGQWKALQPIEMYRNRHEITEQYRHAMAERLESCGYVLEPRLISTERYPKASEREQGFEIAGVGADIRERMSQRSAARDAHIEAYKRSHQGEYPSERTITELVRQNRGEKPRYTPGEREEIRVEQIERLDPSERTRLQELVTRAREHTYERRTAEERELYARREQLERQAEQVRMRIVDGPWMAQAGGVENLSPRHLESAQRSYEKWQHKEVHRFADYVNFVQHLWAENPGMLEAWKNDPRRAERELEHTERPRISISDSAAYERPLKRHEWTYGEEHVRYGPRMRM